MFFGSLEPNAHFSAIAYRFFKINAKPEMGESEKVGCHVLSATGDKMAEMKNLPDMSEKTENNA